MIKSDIIKELFGSIIGESVTKELPANLRTVAKMAESLDAFMVKKGIAGIGKGAEEAELNRILKVPGSNPDVIGITKELMHVPSSNFKPINAVGFDSATDTRGELNYGIAPDDFIRTHPQAQKYYNREIVYNPRWADKDTIWHEFAHARALESEGRTGDRKRIMSIGRKLKRIIPGDEQKMFYANLAPEEIHARRTGRMMTKVRPELKTKLFNEVSDEMQSIIESVMERHINRPYATANAHSGSVVKRALIEDLKRAVIDVEKELKKVFGEI